MIERQPGIGGAAQQSLPHLLAIVQFFVRRGFEGKAIDPDHLNQKTVAGFQGEMIQVAREVQPVPDPGLAQAQPQGAIATDISSADRVWVTEHRSWRPTGDNSGRAGIG